MKQFLCTITSTIVNAMDSCLGGLVAFFLALFVVCDFCRVSNCPQLHKAANVATSWVLVLQDTPVDTVCVNVSSH